VELGRKIWQIESGSKARPRLDDGLCGTFNVDETCGVAVQLHVLAGILESLQEMIDNFIFAHPLVANQ
jgi:hypothetical protein